MIFVKLMFILFHLSVKEENVKSTVDLLWKKEYISEKAVF